MDDNKEISIWFFIGTLLTCYGVLIMGAGVWALFSPPEKPPVLAELHPSLWWGALMLASGLVYCVRERPGRN